MRIAVLSVAKGDPYAIRLGAHYIAPLETLKTFSQSVLLRESYNAKLLSEELKGLGLPSAVIKINNPWYYRKKIQKAGLELASPIMQMKIFP